MVTLGHGDLPAEVASRILSVLGLAKDGLIQPALRDGDTFVEEVSSGADADPMAHLVAYTGRRSA